MREKFGKNVRFSLMNSFSTSDDTMAYLKKYPEIFADPDLEFVQNKVSVAAVSCCPEMNGRLRVVGAPTTSKVIKMTTKLRSRPQQLQLRPCWGDIMHFSWPCSFIFRSRNSMPKRCCPGSGPKPRRTSGAPPATATCTPPSRAAAPLTSSSPRASSTCSSATATTSVREKGRSLRERKYHYLTQ